MKNLICSISAPLVFLLSIFSAHADLVAHWDFEEGSGLTTTDAVQAIVGEFEPAGAGPTWSLIDLPPVLSGTTAALEFDGTSRIVMTGYKADEIEGTNSRSIAAWVKTGPGATTNMGLFAYGENAAGDKFNFRIQDGDGPIDGALRVEVNGGYIIGTTELVDGEWHHVVATWEDDGSPDVLDILLYVDGELEEISASLDEPIHTDTLSGIDVLISDDHSARKWTGWIDDFRIYDSVLTPEEIKQLAEGTVIINSFESDVEVLAPEGPLTLSWDVEDFDTLTLDNGVGDVAGITTNGEGSIVVMPTEDTTYTLTGTVDAITQTERVSVIVGGSPVINDFKIEGAAFIGEGETATLSWDVFAADSLSIAPGPGDVTGMTTSNVMPTETTTYTLTASNTFGTATAEVTINILSGLTALIDLGWSAEGLPDGALDTWSPAINQTPNANMIFTAGLGGTVQSGATNFSNVNQWINSPGYNMSSNPADSWQDGLGNAETQLNVTWELVFRPGDFIGTHTLFNTGGNGDGTAIVLVESVIDFRFQDANTDDQRVIATADLAEIGGPTDFYHIVGVGDVESDVTGTASIYVNGVLVGDPVTSVGTINDWDGGDLAEIGKGTNIPGGNPFATDVFDGDVAQFNYYGGEILSAELIQEAFLRVSGGAAGGEFQITDIEHNKTDGSITLTWNSKSGASYAIDSATTLLNPDWAELADGHLSQGEETSFVDTPAAGTSELYYRVRRE